MDGYCPEEKLEIKIKDQFILDFNNRTDNSFSKLFNLYNKNLIRFSNRYFNCLADAEDTVDDVLLQLWESKYNFDDRKSLKSFLYTATRNRSINTIKRNKRLKHDISFLEYESLQDDCCNNFFNFDYDLDFDFRIKSILESALGDLPEECRRIMQLFKKGFNSSEIASLTGVCPGTVRSQKKRGISIIRDTQDWESLYK
jgi:RNA polymerase sigma factor (sigma-70 family)